MTGVYGSTVTTDDVEVQNNATDDPDWSSNSTNFLRTGDGEGADFEILFNNLPIVALWGTTRGYVFKATTSADFVLRAYNNNWSATGGTLENPNSTALVYTLSKFVPSDGTEVDIPDIVFSQPVSLLVISDSGAADVGIDDLSVTPVPEPSTIVLFGLGIFGVLGYAYRRKRR
ncbi:PEP-CTERM sorting domain-containing protein [Candidatus Poribacteria bacterium]|nr:PEP-CTERM sorting domain-containing protein [Candidatus Poribacteria bacterium]